MKPRTFFSFAPSSAVCLRCACSPKIADAEAATVPHNLVHFENRGQPAPPAFI